MSHDGLTSAQFHAFLAALAEKAEWWYAAAGNLVIRPRPTSPTYTFTGGLHNDVRVVRDA